MVRLQRLIAGTRDTVSTSGEPMGERAARTACPILWPSCTEHLLSRFSLRPDYCRGNVGQQRRVAAEGQHERFQFRS